MPITFYFSRCEMQQKMQWIALLLLMVFSSLANSATYNLTSGSYPPCLDSGGVASSWSVSGSTYTCNGDSRVTLASGDVVTASGNVTIYANRGFTLAGTIGSAGARINLTSNYGTVTASGTTTVFGNINGGSGVVTLTNTIVNGTLTTTGNINLTGGSVSGLVTSSSNTITTNGTSLSGGATAQSGMSITGGTLAGSFTLTSANSATFSGVTMTSGSISGASSVTIQNGSQLGYSSSSITISSSSGAITVNNSIVYGNLTAPNYSTVNVTNGGAVYGTCSPNSTPANACGAAPVPLPPTPMNCSAGISSGITGNYYNNRTLTEPAAATRSDAPIDFNWGAAAPGASGITADNFSVRWTGYIRATQTGAYRFQTVSDDGVRLYINGNLVIDRWNDHSAATDTTGDFNLVAGNTYSITLQYYEGGGDAVIRLQWRLPGSATFVAIPGGPVPTLGAGLYECTPTPNPPVSSCATNLSAGITGNYFNNQTLTNPVTNRRLDGPINFDWGTGAPGLTGVGDNNFSVRWEGYIHVTQSGVHRFQTNSDDGVRLTVNGDLLIDQWNDHSVTTHTSAAVNLDAGKSYPIKLEYYENGGFAVAQLLWQTPGSGSYVAIPVGVNASPVSAPGLYQCSTVAGYKISHNGSGITCAGEEITFIAIDSSGNTIVPPMGTTLTLTPSSATTQWVGGNSATFGGSLNNVKKILRQLTPATININVVDNNGVVESPTFDPSITFADAILKFSDIPTQIAGVVDNNPTLSAVKTDLATGACVPQLSGDKTVRMAFSCVNPTTCISGQQLTLNSLGARANNTNVVSLTVYNSVTLTFNSFGVASIPFMYTDVGRVQLHAQVDLPATTNDPAVTIVGSSNEFVVKPHTLAVSGITNLSNISTPQTTNSGNGFIVAGEKFKVSVQARNANGAITPNFGHETTSEKDAIFLTASTLVHPAGGTLTPLSNTGNFVAATPTGTYVNAGIQWDQVGSIRIMPKLTDGDYLSAGNIPNYSDGSIVAGRFYPNNFILVNSSLTNTNCSVFSYMQQPLTLVYSIEARGLANNKLTNYMPAYGTMPTINYVTENADSGINLSRFSDGAVHTWAAGELPINSITATFNRLLPNQVPDGPYTNLQVGLQLTDTFDSRSLQGLDMNAASIGACAGAACTAIKLGSAFNMRYGRLRLDDAFGPETARLPVNFLTEFWAGSFFAQNINDSCTTILRSMISYPVGNILTPANLTVALAGGTTTGHYGVTAAENIFVTPLHIGFSNGDARHYFSAPTGNASGEFTVSINLAAYPWLQFDWNQDGTFSDLILPPARYSFGSYRGHDRVIYWRERFN